MNNIAVQNFHQHAVIRSIIRRLCALWEIEEVEDEISVEYSSRMTRSLGRTQPLKKIIRLNLDVLSSLCQHLEEILCHELAHIAAVHKYGESISPHGQE